MRSPSRTERRDLALALLVLFGTASCDEVEPPIPTGEAIPVAPDTAATPADAAVVEPPLAPPAHCPQGLAPAASLACTGLYADLARKTLAPGVREYAPAYPLWSDGADKRRWVNLPAGSTIDASDPSEWVFPVGTQFWKEFSLGGRRVETRLWQKVRNNFWVHAVYVWDEMETVAIRSVGGDIPLGAGRYHVPSQEECEKCHRGRTEHILGFSAVDLGLPGATGVTLESLAAEGRLVPPPAATRLTIGDDGTGVAAPALGWLHANCGNTCHNDNSLSVAFASGMRLRLDPAWLDGRPVSGLAPLATTVGVPVQNVNWNGRVRVVPGDPVRSLIYDLISHRGSGRQMPPFATDVVDAVNVARVADWIRRMPPTPVVRMDAAGPDPQPDAAAL